MSKFYILAQKQLFNQSSKIMILRDESMRLKIGMVIFAGIMVMLVFYILIANNLAGKNFAIKSYGEQLRDVKRENARLEIDIAGKKSLELLEEQGKALGLVAPKNKTFLDGNSSMARK